MLVNLYRYIKHYKKRKMNIIVSTAGHIDHGKTYLIEKLTGKNTMHHKEELQRNITIDLGYSFILIDNLNVSIIDVPGHKDYLKNTICGISIFRI